MEFSEGIFSLAVSERIVKRSLNFLELVIQHDTHVEIFSFRGFARNKNIPNLFHLKSQFRMRSPVLVPIRKIQTSIPIVCRS
jgi:hypothetical protein